MEKVRLDIFLVQQGMVETRQKAQTLIGDGMVFVNGVQKKKVAYKVDENDEIILKGEIKYVSRSGMKLEGAIKNFKVDVKNKICLDIGSSTGGFTQCLLNFGAEKIYAVDVGTNQLHKSILQNPRVHSFEGMDIRKFDSKLIQEKLDLIVIDVSFISIQHIIEILPKFCIDGGEVVALIKPQFEVGKTFLKKGIVTSLAEVEKSLLRIRDTFKSNGFDVRGEMLSTVKGKEGNQEYLFYARFL
ncbi:TlyA family RNA methyltransferase [Patescibacteria group bacterium]|nr:TlyA family RNA methyltransferase [Patescibacteria group bacterium]